MMFLYVLIQLQQLTKMLLPLAFNTANSKACGVDEGRKDESDSEHKALRFNIFVICFASISLLSYNDDHNEVHTSLIRCSIRQLQTQTSYLKSSG